MAKKSKSRHSQQNARMKQKPKKKERGFWLSLVLVVMGLHGIFASVFYYSQRSQDFINRPYLIGLMVLHSLLNIVAAVGIWYWKKWALYVYAVSTVIALVAGLLSIGIWSTFYMVLPLAIVGWLLRTKWDYFE
jgi:hypothetical protein